MAGKSLDSDELVSEINVTPLVDVVLVLLVIFMITAPAIYQSQLKIALPKARSGDEAQAKPIAFEIGKDGALSWNGEPLQWEALAPRLSALGADAKEQGATISADTATPHGTVVRLLDVLKQAGVAKFAINVDSQP